MANPVRIPDDTRSLHAIGDFIMGYQPYQNAFVNAMVNRIAMTIVTSKMWNNPWAIFKRGYMEFGETVEEIFVNLAKPHSYDPVTAQSEVFKREIPDVRAAFHVMNWQKFYKDTIQNDQLRQAFLSWQGITDFIARVVNSMYTGQNYDEYVTMKYMVARAILNGDVAYKPVPNVFSTADDIVYGARSISTDFTFLKTNYNRAGVYNSCLRENQYIIISADMEALVDVGVLARAFNMEYADFLGHVIIVDSFAQHDTARLAELFANDSTYTAFTSDDITALGNIAAIIVDRDWWMVFDNLTQNTELYNGEGLYWLYWLHAWKTFSISPFANACAIVSSVGSITSVTVSPSTATMAANSSETFSAAVVKSGLVSDAVVWSISGQTSAETHIDPYAGNLYLGADETGTSSTITVKATSVADATKYGTATVTVS